MIPSPSLSLLCAVSRIAVRSLAHLRSVVEPCRAIRLSALPNRAFMVQPGPCAVTIVTSRTPLPVESGHLRLLRVDQQSTMEPCRVADRFWPETDNAKRS